MRQTLFCCLSEDQAAEPVPDVEVDQVLVHLRPGQVVGHGGLVAALVEVDGRLPCKLRLRQETQSAVLIITKGSVAK